MYREPVMFAFPFVGYEDGENFLDVCYQLSHNEDFCLFDFHSFERNTLVLTYKAGVEPFCVGTEVSPQLSLERDLRIINPFIRRLVLDRVLIKVGENEWITRGEFHCDDA